MNLSNKIAVELLVTLSVRDSAKHTKHNKKYSANNWIWDGDKERAKLPKHAKQHHQQSSHLNDSSTSNLQSHD